MVLLEDSQFESHIREIDEYLVEIFHDSTFLISYLELYGKKALYCTFCLIMLWMFWTYQAIVRRVHFSTSCCGIIKMAMAY